MPEKNTAASSIFSPAVAELVAIGAAIGSNCEPCFKHHYSQALKLGVSKEDMAQAVALADQVKRAPAQNMLTLADKILGMNLSEQSDEAPASACCPDSEPAKAAKSSKGKCCRPPIRTTEPKRVGATNR
jgi:AhpD family alkylhydroperoxidase